MNILVILESFLISECQHAINITERLLELLVRCSGSLEGRKTQFGCFQNVRIVAHEKVGISNKSQSKDIRGVLSQNILPNASGLLEEAGIPLVDGVDVLSLPRSHCISHGVSHNKGLFQSV
jgi:hypothetical protein